MSSNINNFSDEEYMIVIEMELKYLINKKIIILKINFLCETFKYNK